MMAKLLPLAGTLLLTIIMAAALGWAAHSSQQMASSDTISAAPYIPGPVPAIAAPELAAPRPAIFYKAITDRPLFAPGRRPASQTAEVQPENPVPAATHAEPSAKFTLKGTMQIGEKVSALLELNDGDPVWLEVGETLAEWKLTDVSGDWIELTKNSEIIRVELYPR